jgi:hypothetical protein
MALYLPMIVAQTPIIMHEEGRMMCERARSARLSSRMLILLRRCRQLTPLRWLVQLEPQLLRAG